MITVDARSFRRGLNRHRKSAETVGKRMVAQVGEAVYTNILLLSKVDTGLSRSNWRFSIGRPDSTPYDPNGVTSRGQGLLGIESLEIVAMKDDVINGSYDLNQTLWISNPIDYVEHLEFGSQGRTPVRMVRLGIEFATSQLRDTGGVFVSRNL